MGCRLECRSPRRRGGKIWRSRWRSTWNRRAAAGSLRLCDAVACAGGDVADIIVRHAGIDRQRDSVLELRERARAGLTARDAGEGGMQRDRDEVDAAFDAAFFHALDKCIARGDGDSVEMPAVAGNGSR